MSPDPFDDLERQLRRAVREQAAPSPGRIARLRSRLRLPLVLGVGAICVGGSAALAASQLLPEGPPVAVDAPAAVPNEGAGIVEGETTLLSVRVPDPYGGPPWGLRVFGSSRGGSCVQVGRVQGGRLGRVVREGAGPERFRPLRAVPGVNALCGGVQRDGFPVLRGLRRVELRGGSGDPRRCDGGPCPIDQARVLRFGLLGPGARTAAFVDGEGRAVARQRLSPAQGGAYLFVQRADPRPFQAADVAQQEAEQRFSVAIRRLEAQGVPIEEAMRRASRTSFAPRRAGPGQAELLRGDDAVVADFAGGERLRVAGRGRTRRPLPGVARREGAAPDVRSPLRVEVAGTGARRRFTVSFRAPVAVTRADRGYSLTVTGPDGGRCSRGIPGGGQATTRDIARGERVVFADLGARRSTGTGRRTWCPGSFVLRVGYRTPGSGFRGRLVGTHRFVVER